MKFSKLRKYIPLAVVAVAGLGAALKWGTGTLSAFGWSDVSVLCPLGSLGTMIASKTVLPRAAVSLALAIGAILLFGRAFCGWICPVPGISKLRSVFSKQEGSCLRIEKRGKVDSRHFVLGASLLSAAVFGFPVFCLICPVGLTFATVFLVMFLFSGGDVTWSVVVIPALLVIEVVVFRKWCSYICPLGALMSLFGKANKTLRPTVNTEACIETAHGARCGKCEEACSANSVGIDLHNLETGVPLNECTKCTACVEACPVHAISIPFLPKEKSPESPVPEDAESSR